MYSINVHRILSLAFLFLLAPIPTVWATLPLTPNAQGELHITLEHIPAGGLLVIQQKPDLTSLTMSPNLRPLTSLTVKGNPNLTSLTIPDTLTTLRWLSVVDSPALISLTLPNTLNSLHFLDLKGLTSLQTLVMPTALVEHSHELAQVTPRTPELLLAAIRRGTTRVETQSVTQPVRDTHGLIGVAEQEAITHQQTRITADWNRLSQENPALLTKVLPTPDNAAVRFEAIYEEMQHYLTLLMKTTYSELDAAYLLSIDSPEVRTAFKALPQVTKENLPTFKREYPTIDAFRTLSAKREKHFRLSRTLRGLELMHGNPDMPHHRVSSTAFYRTIHYENMPNGLQLLVMLHDMLEEKYTPIEIETFVRNWLAEHFRSPHRMQQLYDAFPTMTEASIGEVLYKENTTGGAFIHSLVAYVMGDRSAYAEKMVSTLTPTSRRLIQDLQQAYYEAVFTPLFEALFMIMRGHNDHLTLIEEADKPACADGGYLSFLRAINEASAHASGGFQVEAIPCGAL